MALPDKDSVVGKNTPDGMTYVVVRRRGSIAYSTYTYVVQSDCMLKHDKHVGTFGTVLETYKLPLPLGYADIISHASTIACNQRLIMNVAHVMHLRLVDDIEDKHGRIWQQEVIFSTDSESNYP